MCRVRRSSSNCVCVLLVKPDQLVHQEQAWSRPTLLQARNRALPCRNHYFSTRHIAIGTSRPRCVEVVRESSRRDARLTPCSAGPKPALGVHLGRDLLLDRLQVLHRRPEARLRVDLRFRIGPDAEQLQLVAVVGLVGRFRGRRGLVLRGLLIVADRSPTGVTRRPLEDGGARSTPNSFRRKKIPQLE